MEVFALEHLTFTYPMREQPALDGIDLRIGQGEFVVLCGPSGCGKTTLLRRLKPALAPHGAADGRIFFEGRPLEDLSHRDASAKIGFVMQSPENQIVTDKVWHELAFGLESLGCDTATIRLRVAEMASFFGIQTWFHRKVSELSGGQKQLLALASVMAMQPSALILDEPTSQLDPIAASEFLQTVGRINRELGVTVLLTEHRLEEALPLASRAVVMDRGRLVADGKPEAVGAALRASGHGMFRAMPVPMRVWSAVDNDLPCPMNVRDGRAWLDAVTAGAAIVDVSPVGAASDPGDRPAIAFEDVWFRYEKDLPDAVRGLSYRAYAGRISAILGGNGTGKTTALSLVAGLNAPYRGKVYVDGKDTGKVSRSVLFDRLLGVLPQNPQTLFTCKTVEEDLLEILAEMRLSKAEKRERMRRMAALCRLDGLLSSHPYDLSGGEQQRAALAKVLLLQPKILLLDEPTKGFDAEFKTVFAGILRKLADAGAAVVMVSHDIEFCAEYADTCALFFDGGVVTEGTPREFFSGNSFYTSAANRMVRHRIPHAITANEVIEALGGKAPDHRDGGDAGGDGMLRDPAPETAYVLPSEVAPPPVPKRRSIASLSPARKVAACVSCAGLIATILFAALNFSGLKAFISGGDLAVGVASEPGAVWKYAGILLSLAVCASALVVSFSWRRDAPAEIRLQIPRGERKLPARTLMAAAMILVAVPLTIFVGVYFLGDRKYYFISLLIIVETILPFIFVFEGRKPQA
ncbi:MAG: ATP-binding cassette domain-containing protein, partial [Clostridiales Family XIII bacterium]|nr:ATP-binding cassette domain-containing protein [Clostridiales Family XIII bacterium]